LEREFPGLVTFQILFSLKSDFYKQIISLYMIKVDVEIVRFGILVDSADLHKALCYNGASSEKIRETLYKLLLLFNRLAKGFPTYVRDDIVSGRFTKRLLEYKNERHGHLPSRLRDFGELNESSFEHLVLVYEKLCHLDLETHRSE
jgi:hypothetical protein